MENLINRTLDDFSVQAFCRGEFRVIDRDNLKGHWSVLFFYPADFTFVCPTELEDLTEQYEKFKNIGCEIYSVSTDSHFAHKAWADASETIRAVPFPMLSDATGVLARSLGVYMEDVGQALRGTFVMAPQGRIKVSEVHDTGIGRNAEELLRKVEAAQFVAEHGDQVCPAKWRPGAQTLKPSIDLVGNI